MNLLQQHMNLHMRSTNVKILLIKLVLFQDKLMARVYNYQIKQPLQSTDIVI